MTLWVGIGRVTQSIKEQQSVSSLQLPRRDYLISQSVVFQKIVTGDNGSTQGSVKL